MKQYKAILTWVLALTWVLFVFFDYWYKHPLYQKALSAVQWPILVTHVLLAAGFVSLVLLLRRRWSVMVTVLSAYGLFVLVPFVVSGFVRLDRSPGAMEILAFAGNTALSLSYISLHLLAAYGLGVVLTSVMRLHPSIQKLYSLRLALGLGIMMVVYMALLAVGVFSAVTTGLVLLLAMIISLWHHRSADKTMPTRQWWMGEVTGWGLTGYAGLAMIMIFGAMCFVHCLSPMPVGYDAMNYYINLPRLVSSSDSLVSGFQPYNWSLLQAAAVELTGQRSMALQFSWVGLPLLQLAMYEFGRHILKADKRWVVFAVLLMTSMPTVLTQASQELKVDLPFTFVMLVTVMLMIQQSVLSRSGRSTGGQELRLALLVGVLSGIGLGIKLTAVTVVAAIIIVFWAYRHDFLSGLAVLLVSIGVFFIGGLDALTGMRSYHASHSWLPYVLIIGGAVMMVYSVRREIANTMRTAALSAVIIACMLLTFSPWMIKNASEVRHPSPMLLLRGKASGQQLNMKKIDREMKPYMK